MIEVKKRTTPHYPKSYFVAIMLCAFFGMFGIHRFYTGYKRIGFAQLLTFLGLAIWWVSTYAINKHVGIVPVVMSGGLLLWWLIDLVSMCFNTYKDKYGIELEEYNGTLAALILSGVAIVLLVVAVISLPLLFEKMI